MPHSSALQESICFFCKNDLTCGIAHRTRGEKQCVSSEAHRPCPEKRVKVVEGSQSPNLYAACLDELKAQDKSMNFEIMRRRAGKTYLGCNV